MKRLKQLIPHLFRAPGSRQGKKGSSLAMVMMIGAALVIWVMCIMPLMSTTGSVAYKTQGTQAAYLDGRSAIEFCKGELTRVVDAGEYPYTFCVLGDSATGFTAHKKDADAEVASVYNDNITRITTEDPHDNKSTDDFPHGDAVTAICAVDMLPNGSYNIVMTSWDNCEKGIEYQATFVPTGSLKIHPEAYSDGDALPLSDFVLVDGQLGANTVWNSTITMNTAENLTFYESMLSITGEDITPEYANSGEYPAVFKTTAHTAKTKEATYFEELTIGYLSSSESWTKPQAGMDAADGNIKFDTSNYTVKMYTSKKMDGADAGWQDITKYCTIYINGTIYYSNGTWVKGFPTQNGSYSISIDYSGTDYSGVPLEDGTLSEKYIADRANVLPVAGLQLCSLGEFTTNAHSITAGRIKVLKIDKVAHEPAEEEDEVTCSYTVTLGHTLRNDANKTVDTDAGLKYACVEVNSNGSYVDGTLIWSDSNTFEQLDSNKSYAFYVYQPATYVDGVFMSASNVVYAGMIAPYQPIETLENGNYAIVSSAKALTYNLQLTRIETMNGFLISNGNIPVWNVDTAGYIKKTDSNQYLRIDGGEAKADIKLVEKDKQHYHGISRHGMEFGDCDYYEFDGKTFLFPDASLKANNSTMPSAFAFETVEGGFAVKATVTDNDVKFKPYKDCNKNENEWDYINRNWVENNPTTTYGSDVAKKDFYLDLTGSSATISETAQPVQFIKVPAAPTGSVSNPAKDFDVAGTYTYSPAGIGLSVSGASKIYANGAVISSTDNGTYYLNVGTYHIVIVDSNGYLDYAGLVTVTKATLPTDPEKPFTVTASVGNPDHLSVNITGTNWHTDGGYHYFGFRQGTVNSNGVFTPNSDETGTFKWYSALDAAYTFRLSYGTYQFAVLETGSVLYNGSSEPILAVEAGTTSDTAVEITPPPVDLKENDKGQFKFMLNSDNKPIWFKMPYELTGERVDEFFYAYDVYKWVWTSRVRGEYQSTSEIVYRKECKDTLHEGDTFLYWSGKKYEYQLDRRDSYAVKISNSTYNGEAYDYFPISGRLSDTGAAYGHATSMLRGKSLYFMGSPSINTHGASVQLFADLLVLNGSFDDDGYPDGTNKITLQSYSNEEKVLVYAASDVYRTDGTKLFDQYGFYEITLNKNGMADLNSPTLDGATSNKIGVAGHIGPDGVRVPPSANIKQLFREKTYPNINMDIANASREQLGRIVSSETIGWTDWGVLSGSNSESNAAYCVTAYVTNVSGNVKYKANRVMMAGAKENNYSLNIPQGMEITTRYLSINADEVTGTSLMLYNLAQDQDFIQVLSNVLGITNSYSQTLQVDYERPNTRIGGTNMISQICRYIHGTDLLANAADKKSLIATYSVDLIEDLFTGGLSGLASTVKTVDRYVSIKPSKNGSDTTIDLSALLSVNLNMYTNYVYFHPDVTEINLSSWLDSDVTISPQEDGYTTHEYLGLFQTHSADSYSGTILFFGSEMKVVFPDETVKIEPGFYRVKSGVSLRDFGNKSNIGGEGSKIEAILLFSWDDAKKRAGIDKLRSYSVYIDPATGEFSDAYVDTGLDSNDSGGLGGFSGGKVQ